MNSYSRNTSPRPDRLCPSITPPRGGAQLSSVQRPSASLAQSPASQPRSSTVAAGLAATSSTAKDAAIVDREEHTSELQSLMRISYADFCLKKKKQTQRR